MGINPLGYPTQQSSALASIDFSPLGKLAEIYQQQRERANMQSTLAQLGADPSMNARLLTQSGQLPLVQLGMQQQNRATDQQREDARFAVTDQRANAQLAIQQAQEKRAAEAAEEDTPAVRAKKAVALGMKPTDPGFREYALTGKLPPPRDPTFAEAVDARKQQALQIGLAEGSPGYQSFVLTGKMPREDAQPLSATDKKLLADADDKVISHMAVIDSLNRAKLLSPKAFSGPYAEKRGYAASFLGESSDTGKAGIATTNLQNEVIANALAQLKATFGAAPTEGERKILLELQGSVDQPDVVRRQIFDRAILMAKQKLAAEQKRSDEIRGGTFYKPGGGASGKPQAIVAPSDAKPTFTIE